MKQSKQKKSSGAAGGGGSGSGVTIDHERFLQIFEKPTQIYRYLKSRSISNPIFLQRNLYYMKERLGRNHKNRSTFKLDSLFSKLAKKSNGLQGETSANYLNITFKWFHDESLTGTWKDGVAYVETFIAKVCHKKRQAYITPSMETLVGMQEITINPTNSEASQLKPARLSIPFSIFASSNGHLVKSYVLLFKVVLKHDQENVGEPLQKRSRLSSQDWTEGNTLVDPTTTTTVFSNSVLQDTTNSILHNTITETKTITNNTTITYCGEMVIFNKHGQCLLSPAEYELELESQSCVNSENLVCQNRSKRDASWENIDSLKLECIFNNKPLIKFSLHWSGDNVKSDFDRPSLLPMNPLDVMLANSLATKPNPLGIQSPEGPQIVLYQFVYNENCRQQTEARKDFCCPWCYLNCMTLYSLLKHLKLCHARFTFTYVPHPEGARIDVTINEYYDGTYARNHHYLVDNSDGFAFSHNGPTRQTPTTSILVCRPSRMKSSLSEFLEYYEYDFDLPQQYKLGHSRLYYHSMTILPIQPHEMDEDSEGDHDHEWVKEMTKLKIDEFTDVNDGEKEVMKMWNLHVMKYNYFGDFQIPLACSKFIEKHGTELLQKSFYRNFILHMINLYNYGLIGSGIIYKTVIQLQSKTNDPDIQEHLSKIWMEEKLPKDS